ncbi:MAG: RNA methyltransferase, partial [Selenomonadaceae bacterium]
RSIEKIAFKENTYVVGVFQKYYLDLEKYSNHIVLVEPGNMGNVGTIIRTADAAGCTGIILMKNTVDVFAGKTVRAAMGSLFHLPVVSDVSLDELKGFLDKQNIVLQATALDSEAKKYFDVDFTKPTAIVFGNEGDGISKELLSAAEQKIYIPMIGQTESLNVSTAAAVVLYEAARQRMFYKQ